METYKLFRIVRCVDVEVGSEKAGVALVLVVASLGYDDVRGSKAWLRTVEKGIPAGAELLNLIVYSID